MEFEAVIGLEIHIQLSTKSKAFSSDNTEYGAMPNTQVSPISLGHPGTLPRHNKKAIELAVKMGLALHCDIRRVNHYSRKNYFYADLPKGYQITQFDTPLCNRGFVKIKTVDGGTRNIGLIRIHMEEDTGKSMHDQDLHDSLLDFNRAGTPLIEVVSEPEIKNGDEAYAFVSEIRRLVRYLDICDGNMEEGSLRCDANVSIRPKGSTEFGTKVEVKNMNSMSNVKRAIDFEINRQTKLVLAGEKVIGETRGFNGLQGSTFTMRRKEMINDYRYFPEPDLPPVQITDDYLERVKTTMPELPEALFQRFTSDYKLSEYDAGVLTDDKETALYFEKLAGTSKNYKAASNWVTVNIKGYLNENGLEMRDFPLRAEQMADLIAVIDKGVLSHSAAAQKLFPIMIDESQKEEAAKLMFPLVPFKKRTIEEIITEKGLAQSSDEGFIETLADDILAKFPEKVEEYRSGKTGLLGLFVGEVMKASKGKAEPKKTNEIIRRKLER